MYQQTVLVVEDSDDIRTLMKMVLQAVLQESQLRYNPRVISFNILSELYS